MQQEQSVHKPMLTVEGQVQHLKDKGITFQLVKELVIDNWYLNV